MSIMSPEDDCILLHEVGLRDWLMSGRDCCIHNLESRIACTILRIERQSCR